MVYEGQTFGRKDCAHHIPYYDFFKPFVEFPFYPLELHPNKDEIMREAIDRGKKTVGFKGSHYRQYHGKADLLSPFRAQKFQGEQDYHPLRWTMVSARIMVDSPMFGSAHPRQQITLSPRYKKYKLDGSDEDAFTDEDHAAFAPTIPGLSLKDKQWGFFKVADIWPVEFSEGAFEKVIFPQGQKDIIHSLVQSHQSEGSGFDDLIRGKGKGIIFLLHGVAGVGKTVTAESVAERVRRPLYVVGSGDLGVDVDTVESNLTQILARATIWDAIVLVDEADVFLEQRSPTDLQRNGLVSVFLRVLEYYEGIMFLTTNRVKRFDKAFKSRIHMAIHYPPLDNSARRQLWQTFIRQSTGAQTPRWLTMECLQQLANENLNGRQIKNVVRIAHALSLSARTELSREYLHTAIESMKTFDKVMSPESDDGMSSSDDEYTSTSKRPKKRFRGHD